MKAKKLLLRLGEFLDADERTQKREIKAIRKVLKALKEKETELKQKLDSDPGREDTDVIRTKLDVIYAQRTKGIERVKNLRGSGKKAAE